MSYQKPHRLNQKKKNKMKIMEKPQKTSIIVEWTDSDNMTHIITFENSLEQAIDFIKLLSGNITEEE